MSDTNNTNVTAEPSYFETMDYMTGVAKDSGLFSKDTVKETAKSTFGKTTSKVGSWLATPVGAVKDMFSSDQADDNVFVPDDYKTLVGDNFTSLYQSTSTLTKVTDDGLSHSFIKSTSPYDAELHSGFGTMSSATSYDALDDRLKAIYEITLLSKKYSYNYKDDDVAHNDLLGNEYVQKMTQYRDYCVQSGLDWNDIISAVSIELQTETRDYIKSDDTVFGSMAKTADTERVIANRAHNMVVACADDGYVDTLAPALESDISYEDTTNMLSDMTRDGKSVKDFNNVTAWISSIFNKFKLVVAHLPLIGGFFKDKSEEKPSAVNTAKELLAEDLQNIKALDVQGVQDCAETMQEWEENAEQVNQYAAHGVDATKAFTEEVINDGKEGVQTALDNNTSLQDAFDTVTTSISNEYDNFKNSVPDVVKDGAEYLYDGFNYGVEQLSNKYGAQTELELDVIGSGDSVNVEEYENA